MTLESAESSAYFASSFSSSSSAFFCETRGTTFHGSSFYFSSDWVFGNEVFSVVPIMVSHVDQVATLKGTSVIDLPV